MSEFLKEVELLSSMQYCCHCKFHFSKPLTIDVGWGYVNPDVCPNCFKIPNSIENIEEESMHGET